MRLILARHGQTDWNSQFRIQGQSDIPLNSNGIRQAEMLALRLKDEPVDAIFTSPLRRASNTAEAIGQFHKVAVEKLDDLKELDTGELDGLYYPDIKTKYPEFSQVWINDAASARLPGGESLPELQNRVWACIDDIRQKCYDLNVVMVSHFFAISTILCKVFKMSLSDIRRFSLSVSSISVLDFSGEMIKLESFNDTCHLQKDISTIPLLDPSFDGK